MLRPLILVSFFCFIFLPVISESQTVPGIDVKLNNNELHVSFTLVLEDKNIQEIAQGIDKELKLFIDLFRVWKIWPDEFVLGKTYSRTLKADPIKKEYVATSNDGSVMIKKRFKSLESMLGWTLSVKDLKLTNTRELDPGQYFIKITAESRIRKFPPVIGYLFIFLSENEFKIEKDSAIFAIEGAK
jgi:hypothetical protein